MFNDRLANLLTHCYQVTSFCKLFAFLLLSSECDLAWFFAQLKLNYDTFVIILVLVLLYSAFPTVDRQDSTKKQHLTWQKGKETPSWHRAIPGKESLAFSGCVRFWKILPRMTDHTATLFISVPPKCLPPREIRMSRQVKIGRSLELEAWGLPLPPQPLVSIPQCHTNCPDFNSGHWNVVDSINWTKARHSLFLKS